MNTDGSPSESGSCSSRLLSLINGYQVTQAIHVIATLGIPDLLANGPRSHEELAAATRSHAGALYRVLRALAAASILQEDSARRFALTSLGTGLQSADAGSRSAWAKLVARPPTWAAWGQLLHAVQTGQNAFRYLHGKDVWELRASRPEECAIFDLAMRESSTRVALEMVAVHDFQQYRRVIDVGGGDGTSLARILTKCPRVRGTLMDLPHVVAAGGAVLAAAGVADRCEIVAGSFFDGVPAGADAYLLKHILHDWEDEPAIRILRTCREAMPPQARLLIVERLLAPPNEGAEGKLSDLNMLVVAGGQERTREDFAALLSRAGFAMNATTPLPSSRFIIEASLADR